MVDFLEVTIPVVMILFGLGVLWFIATNQPEDYLEQRIAMIGTPVFGTLAFVTVGIGICLLFTGDWIAAQYY